MSPECFEDSHFSKESKSFPPPNAGTLMFRFVVPGIAAREPSYRFRLKEIPPNMMKFDFQFFPHKLSENSFRRSKEFGRSLPKNDFLAIWEDQKYL